MNTDLRRHGMSPPSIPRGIHTQLVYGNVISSEIATANAEERIRKQGIRSEGFPTSACRNISPIQGTMEIHAVIGIGPNKVYVRNTSCYCINCFLSAFKKSTCCDGWWEVDMRRNDAKKAKTKSRDEKQPAHSTRVPVNLKRRAHVNTSSAAAFSSAEVV